MLEKERILDEFPLKSIATWELNQEWLFFEFGQLPLETNL